MCELLDAANVIVESWEWCVQYQQTLYRRLAVDKYALLGRRTDRELLEIAMHTENITAAQMLDVFREHRTIADVVADYVVRTHRQALHILSMVLELSAECASGLELLRRARGSKWQQMLSGLMAVASIVRAKRT